MNSPEYEKFSFGLYEKALPEKWNWKEKLSGAKVAGYQFMEISIDESDEKLDRLEWDINKRELIYNMQETEVKIYTMCLSGHRRYPIGSSYPEIQEKGMDIMFKAINFALETGIRIVQIPGYDSAVAIGEPSTEETANNFFNNLIKSVKYAASHGIILALENLDIKFTDSIKKTMVYVNKINSPYLQVYSDIGNSFATNQDLKDELDFAKGHIVGLHIKDTVEMVIRRIPFGEGKVDFVKSFQIIKDNGFYGPLVIEMWADDKPDALELAKNARLWILDKMKKAWG